jgi:hypothetical protein
MKTEYEEQRWSVEFWNMHSGSSVIVLADGVPLPREAVLLATEWIRRDLRVTCYT